MDLKVLHDQLERLHNYLSQDPSNTNLQLDIGMIQAQIFYLQRKMEKAIQVLESLYSSHPFNPALLGLLGLMYFESDSLEKAKEFSQKTLAINPNQYEALLVDILWRSSTDKVTDEEINALLALNRNEPRLWYILGIFHFRNMDMIAAEKAFKETTRLWPTFNDTRIYLGWCALMQNQLSHAEEIFQQALSFNKNESAAWAGLAIVNRFENQPKKAQEKLKLALEIEPQGQLTSIAKSLLESP